MGFLLHTFVKINLCSDEANYILEATFQYLEKGLSEAYTSNILNLVFCSCCRSRYGEIWEQKYIPALIKIIKEVETLNSKDLTQLF